MGLPVRPPRCYGLLHDMESEDCQCCLLNDKCGRASDEGLVAERAPVHINGDMPKDKKLMVLAICNKYGIPTSYYPKGSDVLCEITEDNIASFFNIDFLLTNMDALRVFFVTDLKDATNS